VKALGSRMDTQLGRLIERSSGCGSLVEKRGVYIGFCVFEDKGWGECWVESGRG
jgi:hypothetical protein